MVSKWVISYNLLINGIYWEYNPLTNHLLTSWDIQVTALRRPRQARSSGHVDGFGDGRLQRHRDKAEKRRVQ